MKKNCVILISHMFNNISGGAGTYANYLSNEFSSTKNLDFDFYVLTDDALENNSNIIKVDTESNSKLSFYKKMVLYRKRLDMFMLNSQYKTYILHANSASELARFLDIPAIKIANVNDYEVVNAMRLIPLNIKLYGLKSFKKIIGKLRARLYEKKVLSFADTVIANSSFTADCIKSGYKIKDVKIIYKSCNVSIFKKNSQILKEINSFLFVAVDWRKKGLQSLLAAFSIIKHKGFKDAKLTIVGIPPQDYDEVVKRVDNLGLSASITIHGMLDVDELLIKYNENSFLVHPSNIEALGISILEAMSCGLLVAVTDRGGMTEIIDDSVNGFVIKQPTPHLISDTLIKMMSLTDLEKSSILAESDKTLLFFNSKRMINEIRDLYIDHFNRGEFNESIIK